MTNQNPATFLYELINEETFDVVDCDVTSFLSNALDATFLYLKSFENETFVPEVSLDESGSLLGIAFFDDRDAARAYITVYHLEHDEEENEFPEIARISALPATELEAALAQLLS